ncbi:MAG: TIGR01548 family HAD-type hydrolase, partial [Nanoarchaeota archaeon]
GAVRLGYAVSAEKNMKELQKAKELLPESVNKIAQVAGVAALNDFAYVRKNVASVKKARKFLAIELTRAGCRVYPSSSNFLLVRFGSSQEAVFIKEKLEECGIFTRDRTTKQKCAGCLRIGMPLEAEAKKLLSEIKKEMGEFKKRQEKKVLLFDMDGVLVDVSNSYRKVIQQTAQFFTKQRIMQEEIQEYKQKGGYNNDWDLTEALIRARGVLTQKKEIIEKFQELYLGAEGKKGYIDNEKWLLSEKILKQLQKNFVLGIVTGRPKEEAQYVLKRYNYEQYFDVLIAMQDCPSGKSKPDPYSLNLALQKLGRKDQAAVAYIGDTIDDMKAARAAEVRAIGCIPPSAAKKILEPLLVQNGAETVIESVNEIVKIV